MLLDSMVKRRSQIPVTDVSSNAQPSIATPSCCGRHKLETSHLPLWRGIQRTFYFFTTAKSDRKDCNCNNATTLQVESNNNTNNDDDNLYKVAQMNKYVEHKEKTDIEVKLSSTEAETCELERTIQLMAVPETTSNRQCLNLVKSNFCWSVDISWTYLFTLTLCLISMFVINKPVAAEKPFHHRDMRDEPILNPSQSHYFVDDLEAATKYLIQYGYLACNPRTSDIISHERSRSSRSKRQIGFPAVSEGRDPVVPTHRCTHTPQQVTQSLRNYQRAYKLPVSGTLDEQTLEKMNLKRCGNTDLIGASTLLGSDSREDSTLHRAVKRSVGNLKRAKRKATLLIEEKRRQRALEALEANTHGVLESNSHQSSLLSKILLPKSKPAKPSQSALRRQQMIKEYQKMFQDESSNTNKESNKRQGAFVSSMHQEAVIIDAPGDYHRNKRSVPLGFFGLQRFNLERQDCIRWRLLDEGYSQRLRVGVQRSIITTAFRMWAEVTPLCFVEDNFSDILDIDIPIAFGEGNHQGCLIPFDGTSGAVAHSLPTGAIHLDDSEPWKQDAGEDGINLLKVTVHEIGHVLGLLHIGRNYSVMWPIYTSLPKFQDFELGWEDRKEVQSIYGVCAGRFDVIVDWVQIDPVTHEPFYNTYFFRQNKYWMYENRYNRTRYGDPLPIYHEWPGIPATIDSYVQIIYMYVGQGGQVNLEIETLFFKDDYFYIYDSDNDQVAENGTWLIRDGFPALHNVTDVYPPEEYPHAVSEHIPSNIDAVVWNFWDERLIFFKDQWVYVFNPRIGGCCEEKMLFRDKFPGAIADGYIDAAYYSHYRRKLYMLKGEDTFEGVGFAEYVDAATTPLPRHNHTTIQFTDKWFNIWYDICEVSVTTEYAIRPTEQSASQSETTEDEAHAESANQSETTEEEAHAER